MPRLAPCPSCGSHLVDARADAACPFCGGEGSVRDTRPAIGARGSLVAASLLALTSACAPDASEPSGTGDSGGEAIVETDDSENGRREEDDDTVVRETTPDEPPPAAAYGAPPHEEPQPQPLYGIAPD